MFKKYKWEDNQIKEVKYGYSSKTPEEAMMNSLQNKQHVLHEKIWDIEQFIKRIEPLQKAMAESGLEEDMNDILSFNSVTQIKELLSKARLLSKEPEFIEIEE